jgi:hypothetical protein
MVCRQSVVCLYRKTHAEEAPPLLSLKSQGFPEECAGRSPGT